MATHACSDAHEFVVLVIQYQATSHRDEKLCFCMDNKINVKIVLLFRVQNMLLCTKITANNNYYY